MAELCVPLFCDSCGIEIAEAEGAVYSIGRPIGEVVSDPASASGNRPLHTVAVVREPEVASPHPTYKARVVFGWRDHEPTDGERSVAGLLVERCIAVIGHERVALLTASAITTSVKLEIALATNRRIATAVGVLMSSQKVDEHQAFALLRNASQDLHRTLSDVADEVVETGCLSGSLPADGHGVSSVPPRR